MLSTQDYITGALLDEGLIDAEALDRASRHASEKGVDVGASIVALGLIDARTLALVRATVGEFPFVDLEQFDIDLHNAGMLPRSAAERHVAFPLFCLGDSVTVGMADPLDLGAVDRLRAALRAEIEPVLCEPGALRGLIERAYSFNALPPHATATPGGPAPAADEEPIVAAVKQIIAQAIDEGASDIHLGADDQELHLRYRVDGTLRPRQAPSLGSHSALVQRIKVMAHLDLTQTRRPQDGKFRFDHGGAAGRGVDVRVSIIPTVCGENVVLRLLAAAPTLQSFADLGFPPGVAATLETALASPWGMILVTGPTGSGKTTTLYTALKRLSTPSVHCVTIEDPVEVRLPMVRQVQVHAEVGLTFAGALRSILRQDPDVILLGEIRDEETARIAVQAALTGHLVLSTLHTNDAPGAVARLRDFGCPGFAINAALLGVLAQRLVRRVCSDCAAPCIPDPALIRRFLGDFLDPGTHFRLGAGCPRCANTGFRGRIGVYELLRMSPALQVGVEAGHSGAVLRRVALGEGMRPLWLDAVDKARMGTTTLEEAARITAGSLEADLAGEAGVRGQPGRDPLRLSA